MRILKYSLMVLLAISFLGCDEFKEKTSLIRLVINDQYTFYPYIQTIENNNGSIVGTFEFKISHKNIKQENPDWDWVSYIGKDSKPYYRLPNEIKSITIYRNATNTIISKRTAIESIMFVNTEQELVMKYTILMDGEDRPIRV